MRTEARTWAKVSKSGNPTSGTGGIDSYPG